MLGPGTAARRWKGGNEQKTKLEQALGPRRQEKTVWIKALTRSFSTLSEAPKDCRVERHRYVETPWVMSSQRLIPTTLPKSTHRFRGGAVFHFPCKWLTS